MKISVIMLTYNREALVARAIESVLGQTFTDFEFIIVDNGSTDQSGKIADQYAAKDERIRVIHKECGNIGSGRNAGLDAAAGEYIAFIDDDDWCEPDFLEFLYNLAEENSADVTICGAAGRVFEEKLTMNAEESVIELLWRKRYTMAFPTKLFKRELMIELRFPEQGAYDDIVIMYRLLAEANRIAYHGLPKYTFYRHESNNSAWTSNHSLLTLEALDAYLEAYQDRTSYLCGRFPDNALLWRYFRWSFQISMVEKITRLKLSDCYGRRDTLVCELREHRDEFLNSNVAADFEKGWLEMFVGEISEFSPSKD